MSLDTVNIDPKAGVETQDQNQQYIEQMAQKADAGIGNPPASGEPKLFAGKYKTIEELEKGILNIAKMKAGDDPAKLEALYKQLESQGISTPKTDTTLDTKDEGKPEGTPEDKPEENTEEQAKDVLENKGLDYDKFRDEVVANGELSAESYDALAKAGIPKEIVDSYIEGEKLKAEKLTAEVHSIAGGEAKLLTMLQWAAAGFTKAEAEAFNADTASGNPVRVKNAITVLAQKYNAANGFDTASLLQGSTPAAAQTSVQGFRSKDEMKSAMRDPRYGKDDAYTKEVIQKLKYSDF
jgi:hypothetical protein